MALPLCRVRFVLGLFAVCGSLAAAPTPARKTEHVLLVTIDGLRWQEVFRGADEALIHPEHGGVPQNTIPAVRAAALATTPQERREKLMPFLWREIAVRGQIFGNRDQSSTVQVANTEWISYPCYSEILCGFPDPLITTNTPLPNRNVTVLEWLNGRERFAGRVAAVTTWHVFTAILNIGRSRLPHWVSTQNPALAGRSPAFAEIDGWMTDIPLKARDEHYDAFGARAALAMVDLVRPRVLHVALGEPDTDAHRRRYDAYLESTKRADRFVRKLWDHLQSLDEYRDSTSLVLTTDHGRGEKPKDWPHHGKSIPRSNETWFAVLGPDTAPRGERSHTAPLASAQIAATVAALLGEDYMAAQPRAAPPIIDVLPPAATPPAP